MLAGSHAPQKPLDGLVQYINHHVAQPSIQQDRFLESCSRETPIDDRGEP